MLNSWGGLHKWEIARAKFDLVWTYEYWYIFSKPCELDFVQIRFLNAVKKHQLTHVYYILVVCDKENFKNELHTMQITIVVSVLKKRNTIIIMIQRQISTSTAIKRCTTCKISNVTKQINLSKGYALKFKIKTRVKSAHYRI